VTIRAFVRGRVALAAALLAVAATLVSAPAVPAIAEPNGTNSTDPEGGTASLRAALETAARGYNDAKAKLDTSKKRQQELTTRLQQTELRLAELNAQVQVVAANAYRTGRLTALTALLNSGSPNDFLQRALTVDWLTKHDDKQLSEYLAVRAEAAQQKQQIDNEVKVQTQQVAAMDKKKRDAEKALSSVGGGATTGFVSSSSALAKAAPRNSDGSWPSESCVIDDPTTTGCITARTLNAMQQAKAAGYNHFVSCFRPSGAGEHPKGRACDFAAAKSGFGGVASGSDKTYGNNLAAYFVKNVDRLGVLYVIWFKKIWMASTGWRTYNEGQGTPSTDHTNHVHLSMQ
jgi:hypothetical protein